ncbi:metal-dependent hydrolase [Candidatus Saccharibacteria bacterium]|nr:MAG: metal-dependent hydrolase [Candidatus Saccharibacteria bacterium]
MANYKGHIVGGLLCNTAYIAAVKLAPGETLAATAGLLSQWQLLVALYVVAVLFSLWPDVDTNSKGQNIFYGLAFFADVLLIASSRLEAAAYLGLLAMTPIVGRHRGWTHSKLAMMLVPLPLVLVPYLHSSRLLPTMLLVYGAAVAGYFSHLLFDGLIVKGFRVKGSRYD